MKLCASYHSAPSRWQKLDEIRYPVAQLDQAIEGLEKYPGCKMIIEVINLAKSGITGKKLSKIVEENKERMMIDCYEIQDLRSLRYFSGDIQLMYHYPVNTFNDLRYLLSYSPNSIVIAEPLTFELPRVKRAADAWRKDFDAAFTIRVLPMLGRPSEWNHIKEEDNGFNHFWLAPDWIPTYEDYIDVLDLYDQDTEREAALIDVYADEHYDNYLSILLKNCEANIPCNMLDDDLATKRIDCGQRCMEGIGRCHYCDMFVKTALLARPSQS